MVNIKLVDGGKLGGNEIIRDPEIAINIVAEELSDQVREVIYVMYLDAGGHVLAVYLAGMGTTNYAMFTGKEVFQAALLLNAASVILIHNHPGKDTMPSKADVLFTSNLRKLGMLMGIEIVDHIIVAGGDPDNIVSFRKNKFFVAENDTEKDPVSEDMLKAIVEKQC